MTHIKWLFLSIPESSYYFRGKRKGNEYKDVSGGAKRPERCFHSDDDHLLNSDLWGVYKEYISTSYFPERILVIVIGHIWFTFGTTICTVIYYKDIITFSFGHIV